MYCKYLARSWRWVVPALLLALLFLAGCPTATDSKPGPNPDPDPNLPTLTNPYFSPAAGTFTERQSVSISCDISIATIRYTTDGTAPSTTSGTVYSEPITVSQTQTIKAIAYKEGWNSSAVVSAVYTFPDIVVVSYTGNLNNVLVFDPASYITTQVQTLKVNAADATFAAKCSDWKWFVNGVQDTEQTSGTFDWDSANKTGGFIVSVTARQGDSMYSGSFKITVNE